MRPPKPASRAGAVPLWRYARMFRADILSAQPERLYGAWMAEFRTPFFRSFLVNQPELIREILRVRPDDFPKSARVTRGLRALLGEAVFVTTGATWARQRRIIDPAFAVARIEAAFPAMLAAADAAVARLTEGTHEIEEVASHAAADVIFRTLFSVPIGDRLSRDVFDAFRRFQRAQPVLTPAALIPAFRHLRTGRRARVRRAATEIRGLIRRLVDRRAAEIAAGTAPDDLASRIMTATDPETGETLGPAEMTDQVAIFFLAGHETSAAALAWALYLLATHQDLQDRVADEGRAFAADPAPGSLPRLRLTRDVFRETLRLYPPVPMMVREAARDETFRNRAVGRGAQIVLSPWHLHRHTRLWQAPDDFDPERWQTDAGRQSARDAYLPFSAGPRVCPGAGFAMAEGVILLAQLCAAFRFSPVGPPPVPVAHLTVRSADGIHLSIARRANI